MRIAVCLLCAASFLSAEDWLFPRGNLGNTGVTRNRGPKSTPQVHWKREEKGAIGTGAALADGRLIYGVGEFIVACRRESKGAAIWDAKVKQQVVSWPLVAGNTAYFGGQDHVFYRITITTAGEPATVEAEASIVADPAVWEDYYFCGALDGFFYAMGAKTGRLLWRGKSGNVRHGAAVGRGRVYVANVEGKVFCYDIKTGREMWSYEAKAAPVSGPILSKGKVFLPTTNGKLHAIAAKTGRVASSYDVAGIAAAPAIDKSLLHYGTREGEIVTLDLKKGKEMGRTKAAADAISTPLVVARKIVYGAAGATLFAVDPKARRVLWTFKGEDSFLPPVVAGGSIFVGAGNVFYCLR